MFQDFNGKLEECPLWAFDGSSTHGDPILFDSFNKTNPLS